MKIEKKDIGVLLCAYDCEENLKACIAPWLKTDANICGVSVPFAEYEKMGSQPKDRTQQILKDSGVKFFDSPKFVSEAKARNMPLNFLKQSGSKLIWLVDGDEIYSSEQIESILKFVNFPINQFSQWFRVNFKNFVFDGSSWTDGFCPPRIFRTENLGEFYWDNDISFLKGSDRINQEEVLNVEIPRIIAHVQHQTWLNTDKSRRKIQYQNEHFAHQGKACCSFAWNRAEKRVEFNEEFFSGHGIPIPILHQDRKQHANNT
jgi:glycosyltransferase involved in cell wall biosynthesis